MSNNNSFNMSFELNDRSQQEFTTNNLIKHEIIIKKISSMNTNDQVVGLVLNQINNTYTSNNVMQQSPMIWLHPGYNEELTNIHVRPSRVWDFYLINKNGERITTRSTIVFNLICYLK